jgi:hypothetical protein
MRVEIALEEFKQKIYENTVKQMQRLSDLY